MNKFWSILISIIGILVVLVPLALLGTCSFIGGIGSIFRGISSKNISWMISGIVFGVLLIIIGYFIFKFLNKVRKGLK